jgi:NAD(P)-dependent dehydrogenase (short-subunit alcohol dehydrogenase family)
MQLEGKVAIVTGGGRGIGRAVALALAQDGAAVVLAARTGAEIEAVAGEVRSAGGRALPVRCDVTDEEAVSALVAQSLEAYQRIDILVNNAGFALPGRPVLETPLADWERILRINLTGPFLCAKAVLPAMIRQGGGKIINVASIGGRMAFVGIAAYGAAKAGLIHFTASLAAEVKQYGIDVNAVCPSGTDTRMLHETGRAKGRTNLIRPEEIASLIRFLASPESSAVTGTAVEAYGLGNPLFGPLLAQKTD